MRSLSPRHRTGLRDIVADTFIGADETERIAELRAVVAALESPADRLARFRGRPTRSLTGALYSAAS